MSLLWFILYSPLLLVVTSLPASVVPPDMLIPLRTIKEASHSDLFVLEIYRPWYDEIATARGNRQLPDEPIVSIQAELVQLSRTSNYCQFDAYDTRGILRETNQGYANYRPQARARGPFYMACPPNYTLYIDLKKSVKKGSIRPLNRRTCGCMIIGSTPPVEVRSGITNCLQGTAEADSTAEAYTTNLGDVMAQFELTEADYLHWSSVSEASENEGSVRLENSINFRARRGNSYRVCAHNGPGKPNMLLHLGFAGQALF